MSGENSITEYYSVGYRPYDADGASASLLERAMRAFFAGGGTGGTVRSVEDGKEVRTRYRLGPKRFRWKKTCGGVTLQEAFAVPGGQFRLVSHDFAGKLLSALTCDAGLRWLRTAYYDGDPADPAAVLRRGEDGLFLLRRGGAEIFLAPCPWEPGTAAQSFVNAREGEPLVVARTDAGDFCFCAGEERARRLALREEADARALPTLGEEGGETLEFRVVPNSDIPGGAEPGGVSPTPALPDGAGSAPALSRQTKLPGLSVPTAGACVQAQPAGAKQAQPASYQADHEIELAPEAGCLPCAGNLKIEIRPVSSAEESAGGEAPSPTGAERRRPSGKYAVAAKGLAGGVRCPGGGAGTARSRPGGVSLRPSPGIQPGEDHSPSVPGELFHTPGKEVGSIPALSSRDARPASPAPENPVGSVPLLSRQTKPGHSAGPIGGARVQVQPAPALIPAKRIVVSSMESYLYFGRLLEGLRQGRGRTAATDGRTAYEGGYRDDMRDGFGVYYYKSGELCYAGEWKRNLRDGLGVAFGAKDGSIFVGNWKDGAATGNGSEFDLRGCLTYTGGWKNGRRHGYGTEYRGGRVWRSGVWRDDVFCAEASRSAPQSP